MNEVQYIVTLPTSTGMGNTIQLPSIFILCFVYEIKTLYFKMVKLFNYLKIYHRILLRWQ